MNKNEFIKWLEDNTSLSAYSKGRYSNAIDVLSKDLINYGVNKKSLYSISDTTIIDSILKSPIFLEKNKRGNRMYSAALNYYKEYIDFCRRIYMPINGDVITFNIPNNRVGNELNINQYGGNGEKRFHLGNTRNPNDYHNFFNNYNPTNEYRMHKQNLLEYLWSVKFEYIYQKFNKYGGASLGYWQDKYDEVINTNSADLKYNQMQLLSGGNPYLHDSQNRFWMKLPEPANTIVTNIAVPKISEMKITREMHPRNGNYIYSFKLYLKDNYPQINNQHSDTLDGINLIINGAPGTGKSNRIDELFTENKLRVTFHPEYTYQDFIGSYKPIPVYKKYSASTSNPFQLKNNDESDFIKGEPLIDYRFEAGPFTIMLERALVAINNSTNEKYNLVIEELNRANAAAVFGDIFQLLDRDDNGQSKYSISNLEILSYLKSQLVISNNVEEIKIPANLNILATINNADQGVYVLDSAFKRRWKFEYLPISFAGVEHYDEPVSYSGGKIFWEDFVQAINKKLSLIGGINEDKFIGPYFLKSGEPSNDKNIANKILMYLWEDVVKYEKEKLFKNPSTFFDMQTRYLDGEDIFEITFNYYIAPPNPQGSSSSTEVIQIQDALDTEETDQSDQDEE
ncbi:AAA family ATPase [Bacillus sp. CMF21]|nr:AAA family ATPase [Bacillus sp. CMF21]